MGQISAFFKFEGNFPSSMQLFMSEFKKTFHTATFASKFLGGILSFWYDLDVSILDMAVHVPQKWGEMNNCFSRKPVYLCW